MTDNECPADSRRRHVLRLALFAGILLGLFYLVAVARVIHVDGVRSAIVVATGPIAPLAYVVVSAALGALFVPGPILAAGSGVLFGPLLDTFVTGDGHETPTTSNRPNHHANQLSTPPWREHVPDRCVLNEYDPSLQIAVAPGGAPEPGGTCRGAGMH